MKRIYLLLLFFSIPIKGLALDQCLMYKRYVEISREHGFKAYETPQEIYFTGAKCYRSKGEFDKANEMALYAAMFGDQLAQVDYIWRAFSNGVDENVLITLSVMSSSTNTNTSFNSKLLLGLYFSTAEELPNLYHLSTDELREYGVKLLEDASRSEYGYSALYVLAAILKKAGNSDWRTKLTDGNKKQINFLGGIQKTCANTVLDLIDLFPVDNSLIDSDCNK